MNGRQSKVRSWMQTIYADINNTKDIFTWDLITSNDISEERYNQIVDALNDVSIIIEDVLFELDNKGVMS